MDIVLFLHLYQPPTQFDDVLEKVVKECYDPLFTLLEETSQAKITINMNASLTARLSSGYWQVLAKLRRLAEGGRVELTGSAAYHPIMTRLPKSEILRQIKLNEEINSRFWQIDSQKFKKEWHEGMGRIEGFFSPEMVISTQVMEIVKDAGYSYIFAEESILDGKDRHLLNEGRVFMDKLTGLRIICRHRDLSLGVAFSEIRSASDLLARASKEAPYGYIILAMDGETFGHHRPEQMGFLRSLFNYAAENEVSGGGVHFVTVPGLISRHSLVVRINPQLSSWAEGFERWANGKNPIHVSQWQLLDLALRAVISYPERDESYWKARDLLDKGLHSDQFWWASHNPCWHYKMVERGALLLLESVAVLKDLNEDVKKNKQEAEALYRKITKVSLDLYGDTVVAC